MPEEVKAENGNAKPEKKEFYCEVSGCLWRVFSAGRHWEVCGDWGARSGRGELRHAWWAEVGARGLSCGEQRGRALEELQLSGFGESGGS